jgi:WD40 repeat protein
MQHGWKTGMAWSPDGTKLAVANRRSISIWDTSLVPASSASRIGTCEGPSAMVWDLSWSKTQDRIAALTEDGKVCVWNAKSFAFCAKFKIHERAPYSIQWSPDGKRLVSTARHGRIVFQSIE